MGEANQIKWIGIRPTDPAENIPIEMGAGKTVEVVQGTDGDLKATVIQAAKDRFPLMPDGAARALGNTYVVNTEGTIYTVPSGKVLYLHHLHFGACNLGAAASQGYLIFYDATPAAYLTYFTLTLKAQDHFAHVQNLKVPMELGAGYSIRVSASIANFYVWGSAMGWLL